jgi:phosphoribosylanthranilate isomerase
LAPQPGYAPKVKICGITNLADAELILASGADMIGLNFVPSSKRFLDVSEARRITEWLRGRIEVIGVVADLSLEQSVALRADTGVDGLQHHGGESPEWLRQMPPNDFKAVRIADTSDVAAAAEFRGPRLLLDAKVGDALGGTGHSFDWSLTKTLPVARDVLLAGGLNPHNVAAAIAQVRPWAVDVASGVERLPRQKDEALVYAFVRNARASSI